jgi:poly(A) polymerase
VGRVVLPGTPWQIDFSALQGDIRQDLGRRDFTIDAMAWELDKPFNDVNIIDPFYGREDLRRGVIRVVSAEVFKSDPVRLLRAVRIAAELGFHIDAATESLIRRDRNLIAQVPGERSREELLRLLAMPGAGKRLASMDETGLLTALISELEPARGVEQPKMHIWDVLRHSIESVAAVEFLLREGDWEHTPGKILDPVPWSAKLKEHFNEETGHGSTRKSLLKLEALLHDIAKPRTKTVEGGRARFLGHPQQGADEAATIMERLRFSRREIQYIELLVKYHLRPTQMSQEGIPTRRAIYRFFRDTGETGIDILFLSLADHLAARGPELDKVQWREHAEMTGSVLERHFEEASLSKPPKLIDGNDIMKAYRLAPGRQIGELLEALKEAQAEGEVTDKRSALEYIARLLKNTGDAGKNGMKE